MNSFVKPFLSFDPSLYVERMKKDLFAFIPGREFCVQFIGMNSEINNFSKQWDDLKLDAYMGDGGTYRYRRYGQFSKAGNSRVLKLLPHESYVQSKEVNYLNGDIERMFEPLAGAFVASPILQRLLLTLADIYD